ncbi:DEAH-box RNA helicase [Purpureocillium lavendulum]|uniref:RNA helicase n=1 Tax=Purpureocillium lavendulum TaxID=1247861 RepID=A0AB34FHD9_9HYPO|nr:DEAH-box RNA helicase [Purpureocillium lavendulum]
MAKVLARQKANENTRHEVQDTNQELLPAEKKALEDKEKRARMKEELRQDGVKVSGKKAKRLEKYIDNKLRKDENRELLAKLAARKVDTSLFTSSKALGQGRETKKQQISRALREKRAGIEDEEADDVLFEKREAQEDEAATDESDHADEGGAKLNDAIVTKTTKAVASAVPPPAQSAPVPVGSGLKRPLEVDDEGRPMIKKRQKRGGVKSKIHAPPPEPLVHSDDDDEDVSGSDEEEWGGFSDDGTEKKDHNDEGSSEGDDSDSSNEDDSDAGSSDESSDESMADNENDGVAQRQSAFKSWALQQRNEALGFQPTSATATSLAIPKPDNFVPRAPEQDPLPMELQPTTRTGRKVYSVTVTRLPEIQEARMQLPVVSEEQRLMEAIHDNDIVVICGATGSGKTTQVPQFLYEAGYGSPDSPTPGMIGITQPRRVAAVSMSKRVSEELGDHSKSVAYQIRFEGTVDANTAIKFMTDGVLLREVAQDITLRKYSAIIIDEAHERSVNTDILIGMLSRVIKLRAELAQEDPTFKPLKLIIMSATLRIEDLTMNTKLFATPPPVLEVEGRQHPVTIHFARKTHHDYVEEAFRKISRGHRKLPPGGFLVFLTGRNEIIQLSKRLKAAFGGVHSAEGPKVQISAADAPVEVEDIEFGDVDDYADGDDMEGMSSDEEDEEEFQIEDEEQEAPPLKMQVLPLYSLLPTREQMRVFESPPDGTRQIILATNVAETSLTIPGTRFVFDCGRSKERHYDRLSGVQSYDIGWISKASANQRSGRAGRTGPGHCYRLYSSAVYERDFAAFADPELLRMPIEGVVLQLKAMNLQNVVNFPFPTPPNRQNLAKSEKLLTYLSALSTSGQVTDIGKTMSIFPLSPRFARILLVGHLHDCLPYTIAMVAGLSVPEVFLPENQAIPALAAKDDTEIRTNADVIAESRQAEARKKFNEVHKTFCFLDDRSDAIKLLQVVGEFAHDPTEKWCEEHFVRFKVLKETQQLRNQITELLRTNISAFANLKYQEKLDAPTAKQVSALKQMVARGFVDQVALRADMAPNPPEQYRKPRRAIDVPYIPLVPLSSGPSSENDGLVYIHPTSPLAHLSPQECPEYIVFSQLQRATPSGLDPEKKPKTRMLALTDVTGSQLSGLAKGTPLISYGKPIKEVKTATSGSGETTRECWVVPYLRAESTGGQGWPLPAKKVKQKKVPGKGWVVDSVIMVIQFPLFPGVALVTGAGSGIGRRVAISFAAEGCRQIAILDRDPPGLGDTKGMIEAAAPEDVRVCPLVVDVCDINDIDLAFKKAIGQFGRVDYAVNCAGIFSEGKKSTEIDPVEFDKIMDTNFRGLWHCSRQALFYMLKQDPLPTHDGRPGNRGSIVNISSNLGIVSKEASPAYNASKTAIVSLTRSDAIDAIIQALSLILFYRTPLTAHIPSDAAGVLKAPLKRKGTPQEVADAVLFLSSPKASFIQGANLVVDGGYVIN